ncbi:MAG: hypothetical protein ACYTHJ_04830 [Planctomycetota bacterium]
MNNTVTIAKWRGRGAWPIVVILSCPVLLLAACQSGDPAAEFTAYVSELPEDQRPRDWDHTLKLMSRRAPQVGDIAPDFTLDMYGGQRAITRSAYQDGRPMVLIFGSYT